MSLDLTRRTIVGAGGLLMFAPQAWADTEATVETTEGRYKGRVVNGVSVFKGMRYGADTATTGRFLPPKSPPKFAGVREAFEYGDQTPQAAGGLAGAQVMSEDCLRINVWTSEAKRGRKRPVLLWFHGGGFEAGSGASALYDGTNMVKRGDIVLATINHRLNVFGFCDLSQHLGDEFARSGNVGYLDLVQSMKWVKANIAAFGGDPNNVMIYGQSGGGRKVSICFAGKDASGLFAKGVVQSGSHLKVQTREQANANTTALLKALEIDPKNARDLQKVPIAKLGEVQRGVIAKAGYRFEPVMDGITFTEHPFIPNAPARSAKVPMLVGTTKTELSNQLGRDPAVYTMDDAALRKRLADYYPAEDIDPALKVFKASSPGASTSELFFKMTSWKSYIRNATLMAEKRAALNGEINPTWMYQVTWRSPAEGGRRISQHTLDLPFMFDNVARAENLTGPQTEETRYMANAMADAWIAFARTGNPNHKGLPNWPTYGYTRRQVMLFEVPAKLAEDPFQAERTFMDRYDPVRTTAQRDE